MIGKFQAARCRKGKIKFGIDIPGTVKDNISLDEANGNTLFRYAIKLDMKNSRYTLKLCKKKDGKLLLSILTLIDIFTCHLIFDLKLDMTRKAQYVASGHITDVITYMTYSSAVSCDTVCIELLMGALNNL